MFVTQRVNLLGILDVADSTVSTSEFVFTSIEGASVLEVSSLIFMFMVPLVVLPIVD